MESGSGRLCFDFDLDLDPSRASQGNLFFELGNRDNAVVFPAGSGTRRMMSMEESSKIRRPFFFSSPDQEYSLFDHEDNNNNNNNYYDDDQLMPDHKKRRLTPHQVHLLEKSFEAENKLEPERKTQLAKKLGLQPRQVAVWFQNRRARWKTKQLERDYDLLKASLDSLRSNYDSLLRDNQNLKSQVVSLTNKLEAKENGREAASGQKVDLFPGEPAIVGAVQPEVKVEDRLSTGSGGSAVFNEEDGRQLVDSVDSYFPNEEYTAAAVNGIQSEEGDGGSDDGRSYFSDDVVFGATQQLGCWVWP